MDKNSLYTVTEFYLDDYNQMSVRVCVQIILHEKNFFSDIFYSLKSKGATFEPKTAGHNWWNVQIYVAADFRAWASG